MLKINKLFIKIFLSLFFLTSAFIYAGTVSEILKQGEYLIQGESKNFPELGCYLKLQGDGNLILFYGEPGDGSRPLWTSDSAGTSGDYFIFMQHDGNLVLYSGMLGKATGVVFRTGTVGDIGDYFFGIDENRRLTVNTGTIDNIEEELWANVRDRFVTGDKLLSEEVLINPDIDNVFIVLQIDGNLLLKRGLGPKDPQREVIWSSGVTGAVGDYYLNLQQDGNLVIYAGVPGDNNGALWASGTFYNTSDTFLKAGSMMPVLYAGTSENPGAIIWGEESTTWEILVGGDSYEHGYSVAQTTDNGFIIAGYTGSLGAGASDAYLIKLSSSGNVEWEKTFGGTASDYAFSAEQTTDGGFIIVGETSSMGAGYDDAYLVKTDANGNLIWEKTFGSADHDEVGHSVKETTDGGFIVAGTKTTIDLSKYQFTYDYLYVFKTDANGKLVWEVSFTDGDLTEGKSIVETADGGFVICGQNHSTFKAFMLKMDTTGDVLWEKEFAYGSDGTCLKKTTDGGFIMTGGLWSSGDINWQVYLVKTDADGDVLWEKLHGRLGYDMSESIAQTADGGYIVSSTSRGPDTQTSDLFLMKTDSIGELVWEKSFSGVDEEHAYGVIQTLDGGYVVTGSTYSYDAVISDVYVIKTDENGEVE